LNAAFWLLNYVVFVAPRRLFDEVAILDLQPSNRVVA
jgi:hypothetical protein